jgi:hypothetical protein
MAKNSARSKAGKKLLAHALDEFYCFENDEIENELDVALLKFKGQRRWRMLVRSYLWSKPTLREKIVATACKMFNVPDHQPYTKAVKAETK